MKYKVIFINHELEQVFTKMDNEDPIKRALIRAIESIKNNPLAGRNVKKKLIPKKLIQKHEINNLRIYNLPSAWRMIYTITPSEIKIISVILDWMNHKDYERLFKF